jgi:hypothetical protein
MSAKKLTTTERIINFNGPGELTVAERAVFLAWRFWRGDEFTTSQVATMLGVSHNAAYKQLCGLSHILPIYLEMEHINDGDYRWLWKLVR